MKITMDGEYALRKDPYTPVRILCVDRPKANLSVIALTEEGNLREVNSSGACINSGYEHPFDLVPLQEKPREYWAILCPNGTVWEVKDDKETAEHVAKSMSHAYKKSIICKGRGSHTVVQMKPVVS